MPGLLFDFFSNPLLIGLYLGFIVIALSVHEFAHAKAADMLGDPTPRLQGRLTLDPRAHLDVWGSLMFLLAGFGWGKPVQFDPYNLQNPRKDTMQIAFAGPLSNIIMALGTSLVFKVLFFLVPTFPEVFWSIAKVFISLNVTLAVFNLIPIEPLDGFKIVGGLLSEEQAIKWYSLRPYGMFFLIAVIIPWGAGPSIAQIIIQGIGGTIVRFLT
ncbi:MAG TPA: site-2 protease family protein [Candidatus Woesebacteria bacterium]|nr:site-2 protease family protein [Candidatus Woesebacteria bacterium]HNS95046.1 site-2 protease family protein [Candidatus Woesebacteria bacterium]